MEEKGNEAYLMALKCRGSRDYVGMRHHFELAASKGHPGACREWYELSWATYAERRALLLAGSRGNCDGAAACAVQLWCDQQVFEDEVAPLPDSPNHAYIEMRMKELRASNNGHAVAMHGVFVGDWAAGVNSLWHFASPLLEKRVVVADQVWKVFDAVEQRDFGPGMRLLASLSNNSYVMWWFGKWLWTYWNDRRGLERDSQEAHMWLLESARQGDADGANDLIELLFDDSSSVSDWVAGAYWLMASWTRKDLIPARLEFRDTGRRVMERLRELYIYGRAFRPVAMLDRWSVQNVVITSDMMATANRVYSQTRGAAEAAMLLWLCSQRFDATSLVYMLPRAVAVLIWKEYIHPFRAFPDVWNVDLM